MCSSQIQIQHNVKISKCESRLYFQKSSWKNLKKSLKKILELEQNNKTLFINRSHVMGPWGLF